MSNDESNAYNQAAAQMRSVSAMVAALNCDYDRLAELQEQLEALSDDRAFLDADDREELERLEAEAGDCEDADEARQRIEEDALSVEVRSDWQGLGETLTAAQFCILLCTGGPAVRIIGELNEHGEPCRAWVEYQDWGTPWTEYHGEAFDHDALLTYAQCFYFGE